MQTRHERDALEAVCGFDTPTLFNALERFGVTRPNTGFTSPDLRCHFPELGTVAGYAVTSRWSGDQPAGLGRKPPCQGEYLRWLAGQPGPRLAVSQDMDMHPVGAGWGEWWCNVHKAMGCVGAVVQGGMRDLEGLQRLGFHCFSTHVCVGHGYDVEMDYGGPVRVAGLEVRPGDLLVGDRHGLLHIPEDIPLRELCLVATKIRELEAKVFIYCQSPQFSIDGYLELASSVQGDLPSPARCEDGAG